MKFKIYCFIEEETQEKAENKFNKLINKLKDSVEDYFYFEEVKE